MPFFHIFLYVYYNLVITFFLEAFLTVHSCSHFFLFQLNTHSMLNTYVYHQLPPTCFVVCYAIFMQLLINFAC